MLQPKQEANEQACGLIAETPSGQFVAATVPYNVTSEAVRSIFQDRNLGRFGLPSLYVCSFLPVGPGCEAMHFAACNALFHLQAALSAVLSSS